MLKKLSEIWLRLSSYSKYFEGRSGDLILAYEATEKKGEKFILQLIAGMKLIKPEMSETVRQITGCE